MIKKISKENTIRRVLARPEQSSFQKYRFVIEPNISLFKFILLEVSFFVLAPLPGAIGIILRKAIYPSFFKAIGKNVIIGPNCIFRYPSKISLGNQVTIDDNCLIDARGCFEEGLVIGDQVIINRGTSIKSKRGNITISRKVTIGANSSLTSWDGIEIGEKCAIAPCCYLSAGKLDMSDLSKPFIEQETDCSGPITIGSNVWIAVRVTVLDGVKIGCDSVLSAGTVVSQDIPDRSVVEGNPGKVIFTRR